MQQLKRMLPRHFRILDLYLTGEMNIKDIAEAVGMTPQGVGLIVKNPIFQKEAGRRRSSLERKTEDKIAGSTVESARKVIENAALDAARTHVKLLVSNDDKVKQRSASEILDRAGLKERAEEQPEVHVNVEHFTVLHEALKESNEMKEKEKESRGHRKEKEIKGEVVG